MGRPPKLVARDLGRLARLLSQGPRAHGYKTDLWTTARIAKLIRRQFGVRYHRDHIGRLMASLDWTYVKPGEEVNQASLAQGWVPRCQS